MRRLLPLFALLLAGCDLPTSVPFPAGAQRFDPPSVYREWWSETEACIGLTALYDAITWYYVPGAETLDGTPEGYNGEWFASGNRIVFADDARFWGDLVRHEMLHAILGRRSLTHPRQAFVVRCGGVVVCEGECLAAAGPPSKPPTNARTVPPESLEIGVTVTPAVPSSAILDGYFTMIVTARNPSSDTVIVELPPPGDYGPPVSFSYDVRGAYGGQSYDARAWAPEVTWFAPGETKRFLFDFHNTPGPTQYDLAPGVWQFRGAYGDAWAPDPPTVTVEP